MGCIPSKSPSVEEPESSLRFSVSDENVEYENTPDQIVPDQSQSLRATLATPEQLSMDDMTSLDVALFNNAFERLFQHCDVTAPAQVVCKTSDRRYIAVDMDLMRQSRTFDNMCRTLGFEDRREFPGTYPVRNVDARLLLKLVDWFKLQKDRPDPDAVSDLEWSTYTDALRQFFDVPHRRLLDLIMAAYYLDIPLLINYGSEHIADLIAGRYPREIREVLQQECDLTEADVDDIFSHLPRLKYLKRNAGILELLATDVSEPMHITPEILLLIFSWLSRDHLERVLLVNSYFIDVILGDRKLYAEIFG